MGSARVQPSTSERSSGNLPLERTSFVGREREIAEVKRLISERQLLTLRGQGGAGKTRLALAVARDLAREFEDGVWWVELAPISDPDLVPQAVAQALGVPEAPDLSPTEALVEHLEPRTTLLVLDNCEHLVEACADLADALLGVCPHLGILATSREPLHVGGETNFMVPSLSVPDSGRSLSTEELAGYEAILLFVERARTVDSGFVLTEQNAAAVARLCSRLDGIPLAIELAAARTRVLTVEQILEKLEDPLRLLSSRDRSAAPRQRTLRATLQWSYDLLAEDERALFRRLSVFVGGWDLEAAEAVGAGEPAEAEFVLDILSELVEKSLVVTGTESVGILRYRMLEPVRQFAREKLEESEEPWVRRRHAEHYLALAETAEPELVGPDQGLWLGRLRTEFANLREAHSWSLDPGEEEERAWLRLRLPAALWRFWGGQRFEEGKRWLQTALERDTGEFLATRARALDGLGFILVFQQDYGRAIDTLEEAIALYKELGDQSGAALALANLGYAALHGGYMERVPAFVQEGEALMRGDLEGHARAYLRVIMASAAMGQGDFDSGMAQVEEGLALCRELGDLRNTSMSLFILGMAKLAIGELDQGAPLLDEGAQITRELGDRLGSAYYLLGLGKLAAMRGVPTRTARLWGAAEALREKMGMALSTFDLAASGYEQDLAAVRSALDRSSFEAAWTEGRAMSREQAIEYALEKPAQDEVVNGGTVPSDQPPIKRSEDGLRWHNLPAARDGFVGRGREMSDVERALSTTRLLTLTGAGGTGKTRLALEVARHLVEEYQDGVWLTELATLKEGELVPGAVATALGLQEQPDVPFTEALVASLRQKRTLLILDNCEHLIEYCADLVDMLLSTCEHLRIMATSRETLGVPGEVNWAVPSLTVPDAGDSPDPGRLGRYEAVELFVERARVRTTTFELTPENAGAVADICRKLDGIPLAIELATARLAVLTAEQISTRLEDSMGFLKTGDRTTAPRHRTLEATLDWSHELLSEDERVLFGRLSAFVGGWTLEAAEAVGAEPEEGGRVLDLLSSLADRSLVVTEEDEGELRYRMLEPVRQYALERLEQGGDAWETRRRHAAFFVVLAEEARPNLRAEPQVGWLRRLERENGNTRGALSWALSEGEIPTAARLGFALWMFWWTRNRQPEGRRWLEAILEKGEDLPPWLRRRALVATEAMAFGQGDLEAVVRCAEEQLESSREDGGDAYAESFAHAGTGLVNTLQGDFEAATGRLQRALPLFHEAAEEGMAAQSHVWLGTVLLLQGDYKGARQRFEEGLDLGRSIGDRLSICNALFNLAQLALAGGDYDGAFRYFAEGIAPSVELGDRGNVAYILEALGVVAGARRENPKAARLLGASEALVSAIGLRGHTYYRPDRALYDRVKAETRTGLGEAAFESAMDEGRAMSQSRAIEYALEEPTPGEEVVAQPPTSARIPAAPTREDKRRRNNLPAARSALVGREREMSEVRRTLTSTRLLTLTGAGGCGKTRLALEVARELADTGEYPDGVWLIELASLTDGALVPGAVASALGVRKRPDLSATDSLVEYLRPRKMLLVVDNCEHLIEACAELVDALLSACEHLRVMATSREALGITDEINWMVPSLTVPGAEGEPEDLARYESVRLFLERARSRVPSFEFTEENATAVANICRKLDGMPLAIELATARVGTLSVGQISERLGDALGFLTAGDRTRAPRQRTLRAALEWGYELLSAPEQELFGLLSVYVGGWTLEAAEAVGDAKGIHAGKVLELLSALVDKSLVVAEAETGDGAPRYRMLEPIRQYAMELLENGGGAEEIRRLHAAFYLGLAEEARPHLRAARQVEWLERLDGESGNLRAALSWALSVGEIVMAAWLGWALYWYWHMRNHHPEGQRWTEPVYQRRNELPPWLRIRAIIVFGAMAYNQDGIEVLDWFPSELVEISREAGGDALAEGYALICLGLLATHRGDFEAAREPLQEALPHLREAGDDAVAAQTLTFLGTALLLAGDHEGSRQRFDEALALGRSLGDRLSICNALFNLAQLALATNDYDAAFRWFADGIIPSEELGDRSGVAYILEGLGIIAAARGEAGRAARLLGASEALVSAIGLRGHAYYEFDHSLYERIKAGARDVLGEAAFEAAMREGRAMSQEQAVEYALGEPATSSDGEIPADELSIDQSTFGSGGVASRRLGDAPRLFGREGEQARLRQMLDAAARGSGGLVMIGGEAGIGKTALASSIQYEARSRGMPVWVGHCYEFVATPPYGPWTESGIFEERSGGVPPPPLPGSGDGIGAASSQAALFERIGQFLSALTRREPVLLVLEDLHWSDPASMELLRFVSRNLGGLRALVVVTYRDDEVTRQSPFYGLLPTLVRESGARRIELRRLGDAAIKELVADRYGLAEADESRLVSYLVDLTAGNAFFILELLQTLEEELVLHREGESWVLEDPGGIRVPSLLRQVIEDRLERLGGDTRRMLAVAAVIGQEVPFGLWLAAGDADEDRLAEATERAVEARLIEESPGGRLRFVHALIRETLYRELALPIRQRWHVRVGEALEETTRPDPEDVANHFRQAGDPRAGGWLIQAGLRAEGAYAWMTAVERFVAALEFLEEADAHRRGWLLFRIGVLLRYSDTGRSISYLDQAEKVANAGGDEVLAVNSLFTRGFVRCMSGNMRPGLAEIEASLAAARRVPPVDTTATGEAGTDPLMEASPANEQGLFGTSDLPESLSGIHPGTNTFVEWLAHVGRYAEAVVMGDAYVAAVSAASPGENLTFAMCNNAYFGLGVASAGLGRSEEASRWFALTHEAYRRFDHRVMDSFAVANELLLVNLAFYPERVAERRRLADEELNLQRRGAGAFAGEVPPLGIGRQWLRVLEGEWDEASRLMEQGRGAFDAGALRQYAACTLGEIARNRGEPEKGWRHVYEVLPLGVSTEPGGNRFFSALATQRLAANLSLDAGDLPGARAWLEAHDRWLDWSGAVLWRSEGRLLWARYYREQGDEVAARQNAEAAFEVATEPRQPLALLAVHRLLGEMATDSGRFSEATEHIEKSLGLARACEAPYERALTLIPRARLLAARGNTEEAHALLEEVREICGPLGAEPTLSRVAELEENLQSPAPAAPAASASRAGLTRRELEVLRLVAQGMSNQQIAESLIISEHTVHRHVSNVLGKLGTSSRTAAAAQAAQLDLL